MEDVTATDPRLIQQAVEEVLGSEAFARAEQLRSFLRYVCERTLAGRGKEINEYTVATEALGKPPDFAPGEDSSVRTRAYELRQRLQRYYELEQPGAPVRIELPKGAYTPRFIQRQAAVPDCEPATAPPEPLVARNRTVALLSVALAISLLALAGVSAIAFPRAPKGDPMLQQAWGPLTQPGSDVLVVIATLLHLDVRPEMSVATPDVPVYPAPPEFYPLYRQHRPLEPGAQLYMRPVDGAVHMGHAQILEIVATTLHEFGVPWHSLPERSITVPALRDRNVILIGNPQYSEAISLAMEKTPLTIEFDPHGKTMEVRERAGARTAWAGALDREHHYTEVYGLITVLVAEGEEHGPHRRLIFAGITSAAAHGAADFFANPESLSLLRQKLGGTFPSAYQVVVRCRTNDTLLLSTDYAAHRIITP